MKANELKSGDKVWLVENEIPATVIMVAKNGVWIGYNGRGLRDGQYLEQRIAARYLKRREVRQ